MVAFVNLFQLKILFTKNGSAYSSKSKFFVNSLMEWLSIFCFLLPETTFLSLFLFLSLYQIITYLPTLFCSQCIFLLFSFFPSSIILTRYLKSSTILVTFHQVLTNQGTDSSLVNKVSL